MAHDFWVTIDGERGEEWKRVAGTNRFPVTTPVPGLGCLPGIGERPIYLLALRELDVPTRERIIAHLAAKFSLTAAEAEAEVNQIGIPILAEDCSVMIQNFQRWI